MRASEMRAQVAREKAEGVHYAALQNNLSVIRSRMRDDYTKPFALYSGGDPVVMWRALEHLGYDAFLDGNTVMCRV